MLDIYDLSKIFVFSFLLVFLFSHSLHVGYFLCLFLFSTTYQPVFLYFVFCFYILKLEDAFDLEFRIRENENDTNWVSRLANVGANGTDVLVKSMIYINLLHIFKSNGSTQKIDTILHCLIDEVGILHDSNVTGLITFASERNIRLINGSPNSHNEQDYRHIYMFRKNPKSNRTGITKLISHEL